MLSGVKSPKCPADRCPAEHGLNRLCRNRSLHNGKEMVSTPFLGGGGGAGATGPTEPLGGRSAGAGPGDGRQHLLAAGEADHERHQGVERSQMCVPLLPPNSVVEILKRVAISFPDLPCPLQGLSFPLCVAANGSSTLDFQTFPDFGTPRHNDSIMHGVGPKEVRRNLPTRIEGGFAHSTMG